MFFFRNKILIYLVFLIIGFILGIIITPSLQEATYHLKDWVGKTFPQVQVSKKVVTLYFATPDGEHLVGVKKELFFKENNDTIPDQIKAVIQELIKGPQNESFVPTVPPETKILAVYTKGDLIYVDFSSSLIKKHPGGTSGEIITIYSIVNTILENFPSYSKVKILVEGRSPSTLVGHIDVRESFEKNTKIIKSLSKEKSEY